MSYILDIFHCITVKGIQQIIMEYLCTVCIGGLNINECIIPCQKKGSTKIKCQRCKWLFNRPLCQICSLLANKNGNWQICNICNRFLRKYHYIGYININNRIIIPDSKQKEIMNNKFVNSNTAINRARKQYMDKLIEHTELFDITYVPKGIGTTSDWLKKQLYKSGSNINLRSHRYICDLCQNGNDHKLKNRLITDLIGDTNMNDYCYIWGCKEWEVFCPLCRTYYEKDIYTYSYNKWLIKRRI